MKFRKLIPWRKHSAYEPNSEMKAKECVCRSFPIVPECSGKDSGGFSCTRRRPKTAQDSSKNTVEINGLPQKRSPADALGKNGDDSRGRPFVVDSVAENLGQDSSYRGKAARSKSRANLKEGSSRLRRFGAAEEPSGNALEDCHGRKRSTTAVISSKDVAESASKLKESARVETSENFVENHFRQRLSELEEIAFVSEDLSRDGTATAVENLARRVREEFSPLSGCSKGGKHRGVVSLLDMESMEGCLKRRERGGAWGVGGWRGTGDDDDDDDSEDGAETTDSPYKRLRLCDYPPIRPVPPPAPSAHSSTPALKPDDAYPSGNQPPHPPRNRRVMQSKGQLKLSVYMNYGLLTVHVIEARHLTNSSSSLTNAFVQLALLPDTGNRPVCRTETIQDCSHPHFDQKISLEVVAEDHQKRLMVSVWHSSPDNSSVEFLGCMSFGVRHLLNPRKEAEGWYYLLTEGVGRSKHLMVAPHDRTRAALQHRAPPSYIPTINKDVLHLEPITVRMMRSKHGFGFSLIDSFPVRVGRVDKASPADEAGLQVNDCIIKVNGQNVSRSTTNSIAKLIKRCELKLVLDVQRERALPIHQFDHSPWRASPSAHLYESIGTPASVPPLAENNNESEGSSGDDVYEDESDKENGYMEMKNVVPRLSSAAPGESVYAPLLNFTAQQNGRGELGKQEAVHRLLSLEVAFIDFMTAGMHRYSRPLRHCILSGQQYIRLFQNLEKLVSISQYHIKQMEDNAPSICSESDESQSTDGGNFLDSIGLIYHSTIGMLCQAYEIYAGGLAAANQVLTDLRANPEFIEFIKEPPLESNQPSISEYLRQPMQHVQDVAVALRDVLANTPTSSEDYGKLKTVVDSLQTSVGHILDLSSRDVQSFSSLLGRSAPGRPALSTASGATSSSSSASSGSRQTAIHPTPSLQFLGSSASSQLRQIQDSLVFPPHVPVFNLCAEDRHLVYQGDIFTITGQQWAKVHFLLLSDVLVQVEVQRDKRYKVLEQPIPLASIAAIEVKRKHNTEMVLHVCNAHADGGNSSGGTSSGEAAGMRYLVVRTPSAEDFVVWKRLLEQRVSALQRNFRSFGSDDIYSSTETII